VCFIVAPHSHVDKRLAFGCITGNAIEADSGIQFIEPGRHAGMQRNGFEGLFPWDDARSRLTRDRSCGTPDQ
jgi:hypothetical protein